MDEENGRVASADVEFAHELASAAHRGALPYAGGDVAHRPKQDGTPVSDGDLAAETAMLELLARHRPDDGVLSEESGAVSSGRRRWLLDPIDGTAHFVAGLDEWGTHVALEDDGEIVLGVVTRPIRERRWWAARGHGAFADTEHDPLARAQRLTTSSTALVNEATIGVYRLPHSEVPDVLRGAGAEVARHGASHILDLVEGRIDGIVSHRCGFAWDHAPAVVLAAESGGRFTDPDGGQRVDLMGGIYSNTVLHDAIDRIVADSGVTLSARGGEVTDVGGP